MARVGMYGDVIWYITFSGQNSNPNEPNADRCLGLTYDEQDYTVTAILAVKAKEVRDYYPSEDVYDTMLVKVDRKGNFL